VALDPRKLATIKSIAPAARLFRDRFRMAINLLGEDDRAPAADAANRSDELEPLLLEAFHLGRAESDDVTAAVLLETAERRFRDGEDAYHLLGGARRLQMLGWEEAFWSLFRRKPASAVLYDALEGLKKDRSFDPFFRDDTFYDLDALVSPDIDFLLAGHTHLERALKRKRKTSVGKDAFYYNTGTWARLIQYDQATLGSYEQFASVFQTLGNTAEGMAALDQHAKLILYRPTVATIRFEGDKVNGRLQHLEGNELNVVSGSLFERA
jgi:hypothetical protein